MSEQDYVETFVMAFVIGLISAVIMTAIVLIKDPQDQHECDCAARNSVEEQEKTNE